LNTIKRINPWLKGIGGHSVVPYGDLLSTTERLEFISQLRDPVSRAVSQYRFWQARGIDSSGPDAFLAHPVSRNFQVKKLAGKEDLDLAKKNIHNHFLLIGTVEQFDAFLVLLADRLGLAIGQFTYVRRNVAENRSLEELPESFVEKLRERNELDQQLYDWASTELFDRYVDDYHGDFKAALEEFKHLQKAASISRPKVLLDAAYRNLYLKPVTGLIRVANGLPFSGSYSTE
jgi:hypothetical protein